MPRLKQAMPVLEVADVALSTAFYRDRLGFEAGPFYGDPPAFCIVGRDGVSIALDRTRGTGRDPRNQYWAVYIYVEVLEPLLATLNERQVPLVRGPEDTFYGMREIDIADPDGHLICFAEDIAPATG